MQGCQCNMAECSPIVTGSKLKVICTVPISITSMILISKQEMLFLSGSLQKQELINSVDMNLYLACFRKYLRCCKYIYIYIYVLATRDSTVWRSDRFYMNESIWQRRNTGKGSSNKQTNKHTVSGVTWKQESKKKDSLSE